MGYNLIKKEVTLNRIGVLTFRPIILVPLHSTKDIFTIPTPPFNATFRTQKKLLGIMRFSEGFKIASFRAFFARNPIILAKQHVVRAILRDIFQISSLGISKTYDKIGKTSDKI